MIPSTMHLLISCYGGHSSYGPSFVTFFADEQNAKIDSEAGQITGEKITVSALMINK